MNRKPIILIVDDAPANINVLLATLRAEYDLRVATNGPLALELAAGPDRPDLILLDIVMPGMDGYEVCRRLKDDPVTRKIPVIFISANDSLEGMDKGLNLGAIDYVSKPFSVPIVRARVRSYLALFSQTHLLDSMAATDTLSMLANRHRFNEMLTQETARAKRDMVPLSLLLLGLDHFVLYNQQHGYGAGDELLRRIARKFGETFQRPGDLAARFDGDQFAALLPDTDATGASRLAQDLLDMVRALAARHGHPEAGPTVTASVGHASIGPGQELGPDWLPEAAGRALAVAKAAGRNQAAVVG